MPQSKPYWRDLCRYPCKILTSTGSGSACVGIRLLAANAALSTVCSIFSQVLKLIPRPDFDTAIHKQHEITITRQWEFAPRSILVFDRCYTDCNWFERLAQQDVYFVTRLKTNADSLNVTDRPLPQRKGPISRPGLCPLFWMSVMGNLRRNDHIMAAGLVTGEQDYSCQPYGGETGIRTLDTLSSIHAFQACAFSHSAISPVVSHLLECSIDERGAPRLGAGDGKPVRSGNEESVYKLSRHAVD